MSIELDDGTLSTDFFFQYRDEEANRYMIFFRDGKKYTVSFSEAGSDVRAMGINDVSAKVFYPLVKSMRFYRE